MSERKEIEKKIQKLESLEMELLERSACFREIEPLRNYINELNEELDYWNGKKEEVLSSDPQYVANKVVNTLRAKGMSEKEIEDYIKALIRRVIRGKEETLASKIDNKLVLYSLTRERKLEELSYRLDKIRNLLEKSANFIISEGSAK